MKNQTLKPHVLFELIMTNQCNQHCKYCTVDFQNNAISKQTLDHFIAFLKKIRKQAERIVITFFGGEPLLQFEQIAYFIEKTKKLDLVYNITTNATLLDKKSFDLLHKNNVDITMSLDYTSDKKLKKLSSWLTKDDLSKITTNLVIAPGHIDAYPRIFKKALLAGIKNFVVLPVLITMKWDKKSFREFENLITYLVSVKNIDLKVLSFYETSFGINQYTIDWNGEILIENSSLWLLKQYKKIDKNLREKIRKERIAGNVRNYKKIDLLALEKKYDDKIQNYLVELAKKSGRFREVSTLEEIREKYQNQSEGTVATKGIKIELTNICGLHRTPRGRKKLKDFGFMDFKTFNKTISFIKELRAHESTVTATRLPQTTSGKNVPHPKPSSPKNEKYSSILLAGLGDVFLHPQLFRMIDHCFKELPGIDIVIPTKAQSINIKILKKIKTLQTQGFSITLCFSVFSLKKETYKSLTGGNLDHFMDILKESVKLQIKYTFEFLLMKDNINELENFKKFAKFLGIKNYDLSLVHNWNNAMPPREQQHFFSEKTNKNLKKREKDQICEAFQHSYLFFDYKGNISFCSNDLQKNGKIGTVLKDDFKSVMKAKNKLNYQKLCKKCFYYKYHTL